MNKLKGSTSAIKIRYLVFVFAIALVAALPTRVYQLIALVDANNGYFKENDITVPVLYGALIIFSLLFILLSFLSKEVPSPKLPKGKNIFQGIFGLVMAGGFVWDIFAIEKKIVPAFENGVDGEMLKNIVANRIAENGGTFLILQFIFAVFAIFYFVIFGISHLNGKASYSEYKLLALSPVCWAIANLITRLMTAVSFVRVSELLFEIFMLVFTMIFFLTFARISSNVYTEDSMWSIYGCGFPAALFAILASVPRLVCLVIGAPLVEGHQFNFIYVAIALFVISYIVSSLGIGYEYTRSFEKTVAEVELPDDDIVIKRSSKAQTTAPSDYEEVLAFVEAVDEVVEIPEDEPAEEVEEIVEDEPTEEAEEIVEDEPTEEAEEIVEDEPAEEAEEIVEDEPAEEVEEIVEDEPTEEAEEIVEDEPTEEAEEIVEDEPAEEVEEIVEDEPAEEVAEIVDEEPAFVEEASVVEDVVAPVEDKPKKEKKSLFGLRKAPVQQEEVADDLKPISLADMKKMQK